MVSAGLVVVVLLAAGGWAAARQIKSPAQIAADTAAPSASLISVPVERRALATEVIVRGTVRYGKPQEIALPVSGLKNATQIVSRAPRADSRLRDGAVGLSVSGRPVFVLRGDTPMHRDLGPGDSGEDVRQLERALARLGHKPGAVDGDYDGATAAAVSALYRSHDAAPFGLTEGQNERLSTAAAAVGTATDYLLQTRVALRGASADINQARLDATAAAEAIPPARAAIYAARTRIAEGRDLLKIAKRQEKSGDATARRDLAAAEVDVTAKQNALSEATGARDDAQRELATLPQDAETERAVASTALRTALTAMASARADITAAQQARTAAQRVLNESIRKAADDGRKASRDLALARADAREATRTLTALGRKHRLALTRVRILGQAPGNVVEGDIISAAMRELTRVQGEYSRLAARSGVQVPADEILFFAQTPVRVDSVAARSGDQLNGPLMTVSNTRLAIDSSLSPQEEDLVERGDRVRIEEQDLRISISGRVASVADRPGTNSNFDPGRTSFEVTPLNAPAALVGASVKLSIAVQSTAGEVLAVPVNALSVGADGRERVQVDRGSGRTELVYVRTGLRAQGFVEVSPRDAGELKAGDLVVVGTGAGAAAKGPTGSGAPATPAGASTTPSAATGSAGNGNGSGNATSGGNGGGAAGSSNGIRHIRSVHDHIHDDDARRATGDGPRPRPRPDDDHRRGRGDLPWTVTCAAAPAATRRARSRSVPARRRRRSTRFAARAGWPSCRGPRSSSCATSAARTAPIRRCSRCAASTSSWNAGTRSRSSVPSGSGKSTLLNIIGCLDRPSGGRYLIDGTDTADLGEDELAVLRGQSLGFVFQTFNLLAHRTVVENVMLSEVYRGGQRAGRRERALAALERVGVAHRADFMPGKLSGGEQQRVAIARALVGEPSLLLCDEPTGNLDSRNTAAMLELFEGLVADGMTMLLITHDEAVAARMPRRTSIVDGRLREHA